MALTKAFKDTVQARVQRDPKFRAALLIEGVQSLVARDAKGDTAKSLAERMAVPEKKLEWFRVLNGMAAGDEVEVGDKVKVVERL